MDLLRAELDELMGTDRNITAEEAERTRRPFTDPMVCKYYINGFCPHDLFPNTKSDLGPCGKIHDSGARREWQSCTEKQRYPFGYDFYDRLNSLVYEIDQRLRWDVERKQQRDKPALEPEKAKRLDELNQEMVKVHGDMERLGEQGKIDAAVALIPEAEKLAEEKSSLLAEAAALEAEQRVNSRKPRMEVCFICGALLPPAESRSKSKNHLEGKQHIGFQRIRDKLEEMNKDPTIDYTQRPAVFDWQPEHEQQRGRSSRDRAGASSSSRRDWDRRGSGGRDRRDRSDRSDHHHHHRHRRSHGRSGRYDPF